MSEQKYHRPFNLAISLLHQASIKSPPGQYLFVDEQRQFTLHDFQRGVATFAEHFPDGFEQQPVIIHMNDSVQLALIFYGLLLRGAIPVVINPRTKPQTLSYILSDSRAQLIIADSQDADKLSSLFVELKVSLQCIYSHGSQLTLNQRPLCNLDLTSETSVTSLDSLAAEADPDDVCLWQYTSGTTGDPKAVMHACRSVLAICETFAQGHLKIQPSDVLYSIPKTFFGYGMGNTLFFPVYCGATSVMSTEWPSPDTIYQTISRFPPTIVFGGPAIYQALLHDRRTEEWVKKTRILFSAGAALSPTLFQQWQDRFDRAIVDGIGATELLHVFLSNSIYAPSPGRTGKALQGYEIMLLKKDGSPSALGEDGSMLVKGPTVSEGYWNKPAKQAEKFVNGWYRTGDVFSLDDDGFYHYKGREDDLFKVRGRWVEPYQIEQWLMTAYPDINEAILVPFPHDEDTRSALFLTFKQRPVNEQKFIRNLTHKMEQHLESHSRPLRTTILDEMPRNDNGKVVRTLLTEMCLTP